MEKVMKEMEYRIRMIDALERIADHLDGGKAKVEAPIKPVFAVKPPEKKHPDLVLVEPTAPTIAVTKVEKTNGVHPTV